MASRSHAAAMAAGATMLWLAALTAAAPTARATALAPVEGSVSDARGRPVEGAAITLSVTRGGSDRTTTDALGRFRFPAARASETYILTIDAEGFRPVAYDGFRLEEGRTRRFEVRVKRPGERDVAVFLSRDPYPFDDLLRSLLQGMDAPARVFDLDREENPEEVVRRVRAERPNLILGSGLMAARLVHREVRDIPAILSLIGDPRLHDLEAVNLSFIATNPPPAELIGRLRAFLPQARRVGLLFDARDSTLVARDLGREARRAGLSVVTRPCYSVRKLGAALDDLAGRIDVLVVPFDPLTIDPVALDDITHWALQQRLPLLAPGPDWVRRGALLSYGATPETLGRELSFLAEQVLFAGRQPADLGVRQPTSPFLAVNVTTALALGIEVPAGVTVDATY